MLDKKAVRQIAQNYAQVVKEALNPQSIILFGSYVHGNPREYSDIDIAVVFDTYSGDWYETMILLQRLRRGIDDNTSAGIEPHLLDETCNQSGFLEHIRKTGEIIYQS